MNNTLNLQKLAQGPSPQEQLRKQTRGLKSKWEKTGLLEGLSSDRERGHMSILLENQLNQVIEESTKTGLGGNNESWSGVALPLVRRVFGEIVAKEFVSVQPMNLPNGLIFYLDFKYGSNQPGFGQGSSVFGETDNPNGVSGGFYGAGRFNYSKNDLTVEVDDTDVVSLENAEEKDVDFNEDASAIVGDLKLLTLTLPSDADTDGVRSFAIAHPDVEAYYGAYTRYTGDTAGGVNVRFVVKPTDPATFDATNLDPTGSGSVAEVSYYQNTDPGDRGDFEDRSPNPNVAGLGSDGDYPSSDGYQVLDIPEIDFDLRKESLTAVTRKLKSVWTPEMAQDLNAYHSIDAEVELTTILSSHIAMEIDLEILDMLISNSLAREYWSTRTGFEYDKQTGQFVDAGSQPGGTKNQWFETLGNKVQAISNEIHQRTMRGGANFLVCSPQVATILESINGYKVDTDGRDMQYAMGVQRTGTLNQQIQVYKNPYMLENVMLVGYRGANFLETGAVYAPYIPLIMTQTVLDPNNFTPRRGVQTRYAKRMIRPEFYGTIVIEGVSNV